MIIMGAGSITFTDWTSAEVRLALYLFSILINPHNTDIYLLMWAALL